MVSLNNELILICKLRKKLLGTAANFTAYINGKGDPGGKSEDILGIFGSL